VKVRFTPSARERFLSALELIPAEKPLAAARFRARAEKVLRRLGAHPSSGRRLPEFPALPHREVIVPPYRFFYRVAGQIVWIVAVWHGAQDVEAPNDPQRTG
jgi:plasmid stabilization system protein ParE